LHDERDAAPPDPVDQVVQPSQFVFSAEKLRDSRVTAASQVESPPPPPATLYAVLAVPPG